MPVILLDTCALLWLTLDQSGLSLRARRCLHDHAGSLHVSAVTAFEIGQKVAAGKLQLKMTPGVWFPRACQLHGLTVISLTAEAALSAAALPALHQDPFDRLLVATAMAHGHQIVTPDRKIRQYPNVKTVW